MQRVARGELASLLRELFSADTPAAPTRSEQIDQAAQWVVDTEVLSLHPFGVEMALREIRRIRGQGSAGSRQGGPRWIDASRTPGYVALAQAVNAVTGAEDDNGVGAVTLHNVGALGAIGCAARSIALRGHVGLIVVNSPPIVAPWGGTGPAAGTNPIAISVPRVGHPPLVLDFATSPTTVADLRSARETGTTLQPPGGFTARGRGTSEASEVSALAAEGKISSLAALTVEILAGALSGSTAAQGERGATIVALDPRAFAGAAVGTTATALSETWQQAGGHLPSRYDRLGGGTDDPGFEVEIPSSTFVNLKTWVSKLRKEEE